MQEGKRGTGGQWAKDFLGCCRGPCHLLSVFVRMASLVLGWPSTLLNLQVPSDWWRGGWASPWLEGPLLSIVLVEALCEDGLLLCSKVSLNLLLKHASYNGISTWHIPLERGWGGYHPLINRIVGPLTLWKIKSQTSKQTMNNYTLSQHHCQASLHEDAQDFLLLCQRHPRPAKTKGEMWYIKCQQLGNSWNHYFWGQSVINRCKYSRKKIIWIFIGILLLLTFLIQIYSVFRLS